MDLSFAEFGAIFAMQGFNGLSGVLCAVIDGARPCNYLWANGRN